MLFLTVGTDPEVFFSKNGKVLPAAIVFNKVAGSEVIETDSGKLIVDGAALEFQPNPSGYPAEVVNNLRDLMVVACDMAREYGTQIAMVPELPIDLKWCKDDPRLAIFGCSPDVSAWGEECTPGTIDAAEHPYRYAGCHIHLGPDREFFRKDIGMFAKALDRTVGLASMAISEGQDSRRRGIYGRPGVYRHQPWGMEYRTPSNYILRSPETIEFIFRLATATIGLVHDGRYESMRKIIPDIVIVSALRHDSPRDTARLYSRIADAFGLPKIVFTNPIMWQLQWGL